MTSPADTSNKMFAASAAANDGEFTPGDWALFGAIACIWGSSFFFIKIGLETMPPGFITFARVGLGALAVSVMPRKRIAVDPDDRGRIFILALVWVAIPFTMFPIAEQHINGSVTGLLNGSTPIFAAFVATVFVKQAPKGLLAVGIGLGFVGIVMISVPSLTEGSNEALGVALVLGASVSYGVALNIAPPLQKKYGPVNLMAKLLVVAAVLTAPYGLWEVDEVSYELKPTLSVIFIGVVGTGIAFAIMATLVGRVGGTRASFITYLIPVVALALGVAFQDDDVSALAVAGVAFVVAGALMASRSKASS